MLEIKYITHACVLLKINKIKILMDPWIKGPSWGSNLWHYPEPNIKQKDLLNIDYLFISHAHDDHLHSESIKFLKPYLKNTRIIIPDFNAKYFDKQLAKLGLRNFQKYKHNEKLIINKNLSITFITNQNGDHDASIIVTSDKKNYFFQTDNILSLNDARELSSKFNIDIAFTIPTLTGIYPGFYEFEYKTQQKLAIEKNIKWLNHSLDLMDILKPKFVIPYACDICYLGENFNVNSLHASNKIEYQDVSISRKSLFKVILMGPNDSIKKINNSEYQFKLGNHDYEKKFLSSYASYKRDHYLKYLALEKKYGVDNLSEDIRTFTRKLSSIKNKWNFKNGFNVQWKIELPDNKIKKFNQSFGDKTNGNPNLLIKIPYYRIQRLVHKDYDMGFLTLQNGSIRCTRKNLKLNKVEQYFWIFMYRNLIF